MSDTYQLRYLTGRKLRVFLAVANRIVPPDEEAPGGGTMATAGVTDWAMGRLDPKMRKLFLLFLVVTDFIGVFFGGRTFSKNSPAAQDRQLRWMENHRVSKIRMGFFGLKSYACMGYYTREDIWPTVGYDGPHLPDRAFPDRMIRQLSQGTIEVTE